MSHSRARLTERLGILAVLALIVPGLGGAAEPGRVILMSWDGAGYGLASQMLERGVVPNLARMIAEGAWADGMISSFPTKTASAHAMLWTGRHGHQNGITGNEILRSPKIEHSWADTDNGYRSRALASEAIWTTVAREGLVAYVLNATQSYPSDRFYQTPTPGRQHFVNGYTDITHPPENLSSATNPLTGASALPIPEAWEPTSRLFWFRVGEERFGGLFFDDPLDERPGWDTFAVVRGEDASLFETRLKLDSNGPQWTDPISAASSGTDVWFELLILDWDQGDDSFHIVRSGANEVDLSEGFPGGESMRVFAGNSASSLYRDRAFGATRMDGGDGAAERVALITTERLTHQLEVQARQVLDLDDYDLLILYTPAIDEYAHAWIGHLDPWRDGYEPQLADELWLELEKVFRLQDRFLGLVLERAARDRAHVMLVSDHGMSPTDKLFHANVALERAGLLARDADGGVDLSRSRAFMPPLSDLSIAVNLDSRKDGIVAQADLAAVILEVRRALASVLDEHTHSPVVTRVFEPSRDGLLQPGGESAGHLFIDLAPGYYPSSDFAEDMVTTVAPVGNHVFVPTRPDMLAICAGWGPRISPGTRWPRVQGIDVAPTALQLLDIPHQALPGRSLLGPETILRP